MKHPTPLFHSRGPAETRVVKAALRLDGIVCWIKYRATGGALVYVDSEHYTRASIVVEHVSRGIEAARDSGFL